MTTLYEPRRLNEQELKDLAAMIAEEIEFCRVDGGDSNGYFCKIEVSRRDNHTYCLKRTDIEKVTGEEISYYGTVSKCCDCRGLFMIYDDVQEYYEWCPTCNAQVTSVAYTKERK